MKGGSHALTGGVSGLGICSEYQSEELAQVVPGGYRAKVMCRRRKLKDRQIWPVFSNVMTSEGYAKFVQRHLTTDDDGGKSWQFCPSNV